LGSRSFQSLNRQNIIHNAKETGCDGEAADISAPPRKSHPENIMKFWRKPLDFNQVKIPEGEVCIIVDRCKGCAFCVEYCPKDVLEMSDEFNIKGYHPPRVVKTGECVNCKLCEMICPEFAIFSVDPAECRGGPPEEVVTPECQVGPPEEVVKANNGKKEGGK